MIKNVINIVIKIEGGINMSNEKDITVDIADHKLNVRAAGIIIHNGKVLVHKNINETYYALVGGRVQVGESSADTVIREIFEELGKKVEITGYVATIEIFSDSEIVIITRYCSSIELNLLRMRIRKLRRLLKILREENFYNMSGWI